VDLAFLASSAAMMHRAMAQNAVEVPVFFLSEQAHASRQPHSRVFPRCIKEDPAPWCLTVVSANLFTCLKVTHSEAALYPLPRRTAAIASKSLKLLFRIATSSLPETVTDQA